MWAWWSPMGLSFTISVGHHMAGLCRNKHVGVSTNGGTPKWMPCKGKSYQNGGGTRILGNLQIISLALGTGIWSQFIRPNSWRSSQGFLPLWKVTMISHFERSVFDAIPMGSFRFPQSDPINEIQSGRLFRGASDLLGGAGYSSGSALFQWLGVHGTPFLPGHQGSLSALAAVWGRVWRLRGALPQQKRYYERSKRLIMSAKVVLWRINTHMYHISDSIHTYSYRMNIHLRAFFFWVFTQGVQICDPFRVPPKGLQITRVDPRNWEMVTSKSRSSWGAKGGWPWGWASSFFAIEDQTCEYIWIYDIYVYIYIYIYVCIRLYTAKLTCNLVYCCFLITGYVSIALGVMNHRPNIRLGILGGWSWKR